MINYIELSKEISYALRHAPWEYELEMDEEGWVSVDQLLDALNKDEKWESISEKDLIVMIQKSEKKRHDKHPCVLKINATQAYQDGINFYYGNEKVWLADEIPSKYITECSARAYSQVGCFNRQKLLERRYFT